MEAIFTVIAQQVIAAEEIVHWSFSILSSIKQVSE